MNNTPPCVKCEHCYEPWELFIESPRCKLNSINETYDPVTGTTTRDDFQYCSIVRRFPHKYKCKFEPKQPRRPWWRRILGIGGKR